MLTVQSLLSLPIRKGLEERFLNLDDILGRLSQEDIIFFNNKLNEVFITFGELFHACIDQNIGAIIVEFLLKYVLLALSLLLLLHLLFLDIILEHHLSNGEV